MFAPCTHLTLFHELFLSLSEAHARLFLGIVAIAQFLITLQVVVWYWGGANLDASARDFSNVCFGSFGLCRTSFEKPHHLHWKLSPFLDSLQNLSPHRLYWWECAVLFVTICVDVNGSTHRRRSRRSCGRRHLSIVCFDFCGCWAEWANK